MRNFVIQLVFWLTLLGFGGWYVVTSVIPLAKQYLGKPPTEQVQNGRQ